jgi:hypothetical protein
VIIIALHIPVKVLKFFSILSSWGCFSKLKRTNNDRSKETSVVEDERPSEYETDSETQADSEGEEMSGKASGWDQYNTWVRGHLLDKWSAEAAERRHLGLPPKDEIDPEMLTEMLMFGLASKGIKYPI